jgi:hypothetical protein
MDDELILTIDYETPPPADDLGDLFTALGRDYRDLTGGRILVVTRVESGSLVATLTDLAIAAAPYVQGAIAAGAAIKGIADLVKLLKSLLGKDKSGQPDNRQPIISARKEKAWRAISGSSSQNCS